MSISNDEAYQLIKQLTRLARAPMGGAGLLYPPGMRPGPVVDLRQALDVIRASTEIEITEAECDAFLDWEGL